MRESIINIKGYFHFFDYHITHSQLLLRYMYLADGRYRNIDILFEGIFYLQTVTFYEGEFEIFKGDEKDKEFIAPFLQQECKWMGRNIYVIQTKEGSEYFICAALVTIKYNELPVYATSIANPKG